MVVMVHGPHDIEARVETINDMRDVFTRAWPYYVSECRSVLGSELHYQALLYHCLRVYGSVPSGQLGMNVKIYITDVVSDLFQKLDIRKHPDFRGGFEPIPDVVIFRREIEEDFRRRNRENTLRQALMAVELKASERDLRSHGPERGAADLRNRSYAHRAQGDRSSGSRRGSNLLPTLNPPARECRRDLRSRRRRVVIGQEK